MRGMVVGLLGILKAGAAYVPLDPSYPRPRLSFILNDVKVQFLLTQLELLDTLPDHSARAICLDAERQAISDQSTDDPGVFISALSPAYIIYTSGSTGQPKGVQISHRAVVNFLTAMSRQPGLNHDDVLLAVTSLSFDIAGLELYLPLITGARLVLASREETMDGALLLEKLLQSGATAMQATPTTWRLLVAAGWEGTAPLKVLCGGEALPNDLAPELTKRSAEVWNLYGPTETTIWSTVQRLDHERDVTIGRPIANTQIYLLDDHLQPVPHRVPGQLYIGGAGLAIAYLNQPALTAERFVPNPFGTNGARLYQTGDLARYRPNGEIEYLGRLDQQVKIRGFRIELGEIEAVLSKHESLREAIVVARETASDDQQLVAYVVPDSDGRMGAGEAGADESRSKLVPTLRAYLKENLPDHMVPANFVLLDKLPLTPNGKIDRRALQAMKIELDRHGESLSEPRDEVELRLTHIWEELLDVKRVGVRDDFFSLGGHSLLAVRLMARIEASFGQNVPLASLFRGATIEKQARLLRERQPDHSASVLVPIQSKGEGLPFFCVHPLGGNALCYQDLSNHLGLEQPFYGIQSRGLLENQVPHARIEDMAAYYIEDIRRVQPDGPYLLGGFSMGGLIAFEMARQLEAKGQRVSLLAVIGATPKPEQTAVRRDEVEFIAEFAELLEVPLDKLKISTEELAKLDSEELLGYVLQRAIEEEMVPQDVQLAQVRKLFEVCKGNLDAMEHYRPQRSSLRLTLFKDDMQETGETPDETRGWGAFTSSEVEIHTVPGRHRTMVDEPYVRYLAEQLTDCIRRAKKE